MLESVFLNNKKFKTIVLGIFESWLEHWNEKEVFISLFSKKKLTDVFTWDIIEGSLDASLFFKKFKVFLDFKLKTIQFGVDMCPRIYWKNITPDNTHRYYYAYFYKHEFLKAYYSPEELSSIKSG